MNACRYRVLVTSSSRTPRNVRISSGRSIDAKSRATRSSVRGMAIVSTSGPAGAGMGVRCVCGGRRDSSSMLRRDI